MREIGVFLIAVFALMSVLMGAGTYAYYSGGTFITDFSSPETMEPVISGLNPGETVYIVIKIPNRHDRAATAQIQLKNIVCSENGVVEPEQEWYDLYGERNDVDEAIKFGLWIDRDGDTSSCSARDVWVIDESENQHIADVKEPIPLGRIPARSSIVLVSSYHMEEETENWAQSDSITFDIEYIIKEVSSPKPTRQPRQTRFEFHNLRIEPETVFVGEEVGVSVEVANGGDGTGTIMFLLFVNGRVEDSATVYLRAGESETVSFKIVKDEAGTYLVEVGDLTGRFTVEERPKPAEFELSNLSVTPAEVLPGETVTVAVTATNFGDLEGSCDVTLTVNETIEVARTITLTGGESTTVTFTVMRDVEGVYLVEVDGLEGSFTILSMPPPPKPAKFIVEELSISPSTVYPGENVTVRAEVRNVGEESGNCTVWLLINGTHEAAEIIIRLAGGESATVTFTVVKHVEGVYLVEVDGLEGSFTILSIPSPPTPAEFKLSNLSVTPEVEPGEEVAVSVTVTNIGDLEGSCNVTLMVNGTVEALETVTLDGGESIDILFTATRDNSGTYAVEVNGLNGSFIVVAPPPGPPPVFPSPAYIAGAVIFLASIIGAIVLRRRRQS